jgi:Cu/Ag efflux protein CusF
MKKLLISTMIAIVLAGSPGLACASTKAVEGTIRSVDPSGKTVTLVNGTTFTVAPNISTEQLKPGYAVTAFYEDENGVKVAFAFFIDAGSGRH